MPPSVQEDPATPLRTVREPQAIDAGRVALEVARVRIGRVRPAGRTIGSRKQRSASRESGFRAASKHIGGTTRNIHSLRQDGNGSAFVSSHQRWFLQLLRQVAVHGGVPSENTFERYAIHYHLRVVRAAGEEVPARPWAAKRAGRIIWIGAASGL